MKKLFIGSLSLLLLVLVGCDKKTLNKNIEGTWGVKTYLFDTKDRTAAFNRDKAQFRWTFNADNQFSENWKRIDTFIVPRYDSTFVFDSMTMQNNLTKIDTVGVEDIRQQIFSNKGEWLLTNSNKFLQLRDTSNAAREYRILEHSGSSLRLFKGNEEFLLESK